MNGEARQKHSAEERKAYNLSRECAGWRIKFRAAEREIAQLKQRLAQVEAQRSTRPHVGTT